MTDIFDMVIHEIDHQYFICINGIRSIKISKDLNEAQKQEIYKKFEVLLNKLLDEVHSYGIN